MKHRILVIDDEAAVRESLEMILEYDGYDCLLAPSGYEGIERVGRDSPDLVFLDVKMPGMDGLEVLRRIRELDALLPVVMVSGHATVGTAVEATKLGAFDFLEKPISTERVLVTIRNALDQQRLRVENRTPAARGGGAARDDRRQPGAGGGDRGDPPRRAGAERGPHSGRERGRQGAGGPRDPPQQPAGARAVRAGQLRGDTGRPHRVGAVRPREGIVHRRDREADRQVRAGRPGAPSFSTRWAT